MCVNAKPYSIPHDAALLLTLLPTVATVFGNLAGNAWASANIVLLGIMATLDWTLGEDPHHEQCVRAMDVVLPVVHMVMYSLGIFSLLWSVGHHRLNGIALVLAIISTGIHSTSVGGNSAHELVHKSRWERAVGSFALGLIFYSHFSIEHRRGHHARFGLADDPTSARRGESIYGFFLRTSIYQFVSAVRLEQARLRKGAPGQFPVNLAIIGKICETCCAAALILVFRWEIGLIYVLHALATMFFIQFPNYIGHYGLEREPGDQANAWHSWETDHRVSGLMLLHVGRHYDHHLHPTRRFSLLQSHRSGARLPSGLYGLLPVVMLPPLWYRLMHPILDKRYGNTCTPRKLTFTVS